MFLIRQIGGILRGKATPFQLAMACILGGMIGFVPGFMNAPGLLLSLLLLLAVLNANLVVAGLAAGLAYLLSLVLLPVSFQVGRFLLDGPTQGMYKAAINMPVLALFGFEHYVTSGGMVLGLVFGVAMGVVLVSVVAGFRRKMAGLEEGSERYKQYTSKGWVKALSWVMLGSGKGKKTYAEISKKKVGLPIRVTGVILAGLIVGLLYIVQSFFSEPIVTALLKTSLEKANGATVDVGSADLSLETGKLTVKNLALADAGKAQESGRIDTDLLRVASMDADVSGADLLRGRIAIDNAVLTGTTHGEKRAIPGRVIRRFPPKVPSPEPKGNEKTLDDYLADAKVWRERLEQAQQWLDWLDSKRPDDAGTPGPDGQKTETLKERLEREARELGYRNVVASHLIVGMPTLLVRNAVVQDMSTQDSPGQKYQVRAENISTQPWLLNQPPKVTVTGGAFGVDAQVTLGTAAKVPGPNRVLVEAKGLDADKLVAQLAGSLKVGGKPPVQGGTVDLKLDGALGAGPSRWLEMPLIVTLHNSTVHLPEAGPTKLETLTLPFGLRGPLTSPVISFDDDALADALVAAGKAELANRVRGEAQKAVDKATGEAEKKVEEILKDKLPGGLSDPFKGLNPGAKPKEEPKNPPK
jgi:uncharacterized protein (TIGR03546 family)